MLENHTDMDIALRKLVAAVTMVTVADNKSATADFGHETDDLDIDQTYFFFNFRFFRGPFLLFPTFFVVVVRKKLSGNYYLVTHCQTHVLRIMSELKLNTYTKIIFLVT